jgi:hypothetical protein
MVQTGVNMTFDASSGLKQKFFWKGASKNYVVYDKNNNQIFMEIVW